MNAIAKQTEAERQRIDNLLSAGRISPDDYKILIAALERKASPAHNALSLMANPFGKISGTPALALGFVFIGILSLLGSAAGLHFPGPLDLQIVTEGKRLLTVGELLVENLTNTFSLAIVFYLGALVCRQRNMRFLDFASTVAFARLPYAFFALILFLGA